jgi:putative serine protease PepD
MLGRMTDRTPEHDPEHPSDDDTRRVWSDERTASQHRYPAPYGPPVDQPTSEHVGGFGFRSEPDDAGRRGRGLGAGAVAGLLVAALVVGGVAGVLGAAGFTLVDGNGGTDTASGSSTSSSPVVNRKQVAPATDSVEAVSKRVLPSVVKINVGNGQEQGSGSGIIISSDGEILTNNHVASVAGQGGTISVNFNDGSARKARVVGTDPLTDLAVIKAEGASGLQPAAIGDSSKIAVGENVVAVGSPFGLEATVTSGIVSATNRPVSVGSTDGSQAPSGQDTTYPAIQTDAAINPGNSGGPLVDLNGDVVGINSSIRTASDGSLGSSQQGGSIGLGFAIPISNVWPVVAQLRQGQTPTHARMGVSVTDASSNGGLVTGAGVEDVTAGSPAEKAGLTKGDVITKIDGDVVTGSESLVATVRGHRPGDSVRLTVVNGGDKTRTVDVTLESDGGSASS